MRRSALVVAFAPVMLLAACGSSDSEGQTGDGGNELVVESPLAEFLGDDFAGLDGEAAQAQYIEQERERQVLIQSCMKDEGFDYTPTDPEQYSSFETADGYLEWGSEEWTRKYGYGYTTQRFSQSAVGADLVGYDDSLDTPFATEDSDPNTAMLDELSESEREAYFIALYGDQSQFEAMDDESLSDEEREAAMDEMAFEPMGCEGEAYSSQADDGGVDVNAFYRDYGDDLEAMYERLENDPRIVAKEQEIEACVSEKGLEYVSEQDYYEKVEPALSEMQSEVNPGHNLTDEQFATMTEDEINDAFNETLELSAESKAQLAELQEEEIAIAVASLECGGGWSNLQELFNEVRVEYEQQFIDEHADELADYKAG